MAAGQAASAREVVVSFQRVVDGLGAIECPILSSESLLASDDGASIRSVAINSWRVGHSKFAPVGHAPETLQAILV